jgi:hypothetical protein
MGGYEAIATYCSNLITEALVMLEDAWKTKRLEIPIDFEAPFMRIIKLPYLKDYVIGPEPADQVTARLMFDLMNRFGLVAIPVALNQELHIRLSCFVYNYMDEFIKLRDAILTLASTNGICQEVNQIEESDYVIIEKLTVN